MVKETDRVEKDRDDPLAKVTVKSGETLDLGIVKFRRDMAPGELLVTVLASQTPLDKRLKEMADEARKRAQRVLILFWADESRQNLIEITHNDLRPFADYYVLSSRVDPGQMESAKAAYAKKWKLDSFVETWPLFCILEVDGKTLVVKNTQEFVKAGKVDDSLVKEFLKKYALEMPDAGKLLADAHSRALSENKRVFLMMDVGVYRIPCRKLSEVLEQHWETLEEDFVFVRIDADRWKNGEAVIARLRNKADRSVPWVAILDAEGIILATSDGPKGNIGYPSKPEEIEHFLKMLTATARRLTPEQSAALRRSLEGEKAAKAAGE